MKDAAMEREYTDCETGASTNQPLSGQPIVLLARFRRPQLASRHATAQ